MKRIHERDYQLDLIKLIAILMVIMIHESSPLFANIDRDVWNGVNLYESISRASVPLFFMVSGALLINKRHDLSDVTSRIKRVLIPLIIWSVIYLTYYSIPSHEKVNFYSLLSKPAAGHLWYVYALIPVYLLAPILSYLYKNSSHNFKLYCICIWIAGSILIPSLNDYGLTLSAYFDLSFLGLYGGYFFLGAFLKETVGNSINKKSIITLMLIGFIISSLAIYALTSHALSRSGSPTPVFYNNYSIPVFASAVFLFCFITNLRLTPSTMLGKALSANSNIVFGIYMVHMLIINIHLSSGLFPNFSTTYIGIPTLTLMVYIISFLICMLISKIKVLKWII